ncbi:MAG: DMT family transporter [Proteobacteria bacterium]|nr:DMT family transporter [Pseudomonadota bacterium]
MRNLLPLPVIAAAVSSTLGGSAMVAIRMLVGTSDSTSVAFLRCAGSALVLGIFVFAFRRVRFAPADLLRIAALGIVMFGAFSWLFAAGLAHVPAARGAVIMATMPILTLVIAVVLGRERLTGPKAAGAVLVFAGVAIALADKAVAGPDAWRGDLFMAAAALLGSLHAVLSAATLRRYATLSVLAVQVMAGALLLGGILAVQGDFSGLTGFSGTQWIAVVWLTLVAGLFSHLLWFWGLENAPASAIALTVSLNPISAALCGAIFLAEPVTPRILVGLVAVVAGIALANRRTRQDRPG